MSLCLANIDVAILCGGLGTRIAPVLGSTPKCLAPVNGRPFIEYLLRFLTQRHGAKKVILCTAHGADAILDWASKWPVIVSVEAEPTGTVGAIRSARRFLTSDPVLVCNGDTLIDCPEFADFVERFNTDYCSLMLHADSLNSGVFPSGFTLLSRSGIAHLTDSGERDLPPYLNRVDRRRDTRRGSYFDIGTPDAYARSVRWVLEHAA